MSEKRCLGCMLIKQNSPLCEHCGYDERKPNAPHQLPPGTVLNNQYIVGRVLGQGGFGITYMGWDEFLDIPVAIKEFYPSGIVTRDAIRSHSVFLISEKMRQQFVSNRDRFVREATSLAKLGRSRGASNIVRVQNLVLTNATAYIIMEYVDGIDMRRYMQKMGGILTLEQTLRLLLPLMESLEKVHESHIIHRDISPDNIMVLPDGSTKLIDFGAAHEIHQNEGGIQKSTEAILKYGFAPPEQYQRKGSLGPWTDVYALCATIYYCTTGKLPPSATDRLLGSEDFQWETIPGISAEIILALKKGTAIDKNTRIQTMGQLRQFLTTAADEDGDSQEEAQQEAQTSPKPLSVQEQKTVLPGSRTASTFPPETPRESQIPAYTAPVGEHNAAVYTSPVTDANHPACTVPVQEPTPSAYTPTHPEASVRKEKKLPRNSVRPYGILAVAAIILAVSLILLNRPKSTGSTAPSHPPAAAPTAVSTTAPTAAPSTAPSAIPAPNPEAWRENVLMHTYGEIEKEYINDYDGMTVYGSDIHNSQILSVTFLDTRAEEPADSWDVSISKNGSVKAWAKPNGELFDLYIAAEGGINGKEACRNMFSQFDQLKEIHFEKAFHTEEAFDMYGMFYGCTKLVSLDLSNFSTANVTNMSAMFSCCYALNNLNISTFDTSSVTDMSAMFSCCYALNNLNISTFDTSSVTDMYKMFDCCKNLPSLQLSTFDTSNVRNMTWMFYGCSSLSSLDLSNFTTTNIDSMDRMFFNCNGLTRLNLRGFDTSNVTNMYHVFDGCSSLTELDLSGFITSNVTDMRGMFYNCSNLTKLTIFNFDTSNVKSMREMFWGTTNLSNVSLPGIQTLQVNKDNVSMPRSSALTIPFIIRENKRAHDVVGDAVDFMDEGDTLNGKPWKSYFTPEQYSE